MAEYREYRKNGEGMRQDHGKERRNPTIKRLIVPAADVLMCIAEDKEVSYPVNLAVTEWQGGSSYQLDSREELLGIANAGSIRAANLIRLSCVNGTIYADVNKDGWYTVGLSTLPEYEDRQMVMPDDVRRLYITAIR